MTGFRYRTPSDAPIEADEAAATGVLPKDIIGDSGWVVLRFRAGVTGR